VAAPSEIIPLWIDDPGSLTLTYRDRDRRCERPSMLRNEGALRRVIVRSRQRLFDTAYARYPAARELALL